MPLFPRLFPLFTVQRRRAGLALAVILASLAGPVAAQESGGGKSPEGVIPREGAWRAETVSGPGGETVAFCSIRAPYAGGLELIFAREPLGATNIILGLPGAGLTPGHRSGVTLAVDDRISRALIARARRPDMLVVPLGADDEIFQALRRGAEMGLETPEDRLRLSLDGTAEALAELAKCADSHRRAARSAALPPPLRRILDAAGLGEAELMPARRDVVPDAPGAGAQRPVRHEWRLKGMQGGVVQRPLDADWTEDREAFEARVDRYLDGLDAQCEGEFAAERGPIEPLAPGHLQTVDMFCIEGFEGGVAALVLFTDGASFTVFYHEGAGPTEPLALRARDNIADILTRLAERARELGQGAEEDG